MDKLKKWNAPEPCNDSVIRPCHVKAVPQTRLSSSESGSDGPNCSFFKPYAAVHNFLMTMHNRSLNCGLPCKSWQLAKIGLIYKKGKATDCSNYRPISSTSCVGKNFYTVISNRLMTFLLKTVLTTTTSRKDLFSK